MDVVGRIARLSEAARTEAARGRRRQRKKKKKLDPDRYHKKHGRCPDGFTFDEKRGRCAKNPDAEPPEPEEKEPVEEPTEPPAEDVKEPVEEPTEPEPEQRPEPTDEEKQQAKEKRQTKTPEQRRRAEDALERIAERAADSGNFEQYMKAADKMRAEGLLPDRKTAELLVQLDSPDDIDTEDPAELKRLIKQQSKQRTHESRVLKEQIRSLEGFENRRQLAVEAGDKPPVLDIAKMLRDIEVNYGRTVVDEKEREAVAEQGLDVFKQGLKKSGSSPGTWLYDFRKWLASTARPMPKWNKRSSAAVTATRRWDDRSSWQVGFPPYDQDRIPRSHLPDEPSGRHGFPPYGDFDVQAPRVERDLKIEHFPPYQKVDAPLHVDNVGFPPYNDKEPKTKSYKKGHDDPRPGFPPYNLGDTYRIQH